MKTLKQNKVLAYLLAILTAFCAFIGVMLPNTANVALADTADRITNATFPDTSTWEEKEATEFTAGKIYRLKFGPIKFNDEEIPSGFPEWFIFSSLSGQELIDTYGDDFTALPNIGFHPGETADVSNEEGVFVSNVYTLSKEIEVDDEIGVYVYSCVDFVFYGEGLKLHHLNMAGTYCHECFFEECPNDCSVLYELIAPANEELPEDEIPGEETPGEELPEENGGIKLPDSNEVVDFINRNTLFSLMCVIAPICLISLGLYFVLCVKKK